MNKADVDNRFSYHPPKTERVVKLHERVRAECLSLAFDIDEMLPDSREKAVAITKLEEVMFWANAAIARNN